MERKPQSLVPLDAKFNGKPSTISLIWDIDDGWLGIEDVEDGFRLTLSTDECRALRNLLERLFW